MQHISRTELRKTIGRNVCRLMKEKHFYISTLQERTGISRNTIVNIRRGRHLPSFENAVILSCVLEVRLDDLIADICHDHA